MHGCMGKAFHPFRSANFLGRTSTQASSSSSAQHPTKPLAQSPATSRHRWSNSFIPHSRSSRCMHTCPVSTSTQCRALFSSPQSNTHKSTHSSHPHPHRRHRPRHSLAATATAEQAPSSSAPNEEPSIIEQFYETAVGPLLDHPFSPLTQDATDEQLATYAQKWGYTKVGRAFPGGANARILAQSLPVEVFQHQPLQLPLALLKGIGIYAACVAILHSCSWLPSILTPVLWGIMGTAYAGLFTVASHCAHYSVLPSPSTIFLQDLIGAALMAPALYPFVTWRAQYLGHVLRPLTLDYDDRAWRPMTTQEYAALPQRAAMLTRLIHGTPLKLIASIGHWFKSFDNFDLKPYFKDNRGGFLSGWVAPALFVGFVVPELIVKFGIGGLFSYYLAPMLVFHFWLSTLTLVANRGPHIPWNMYGPTWDEGQAIVNGTVTLKLPQWIEFLLNDANYHLPAHISIYIPWYHLRKAHESVQGALGVYLTEARLNLRLLTNIISRWQLFDQEQQTYVPFPSPLVTEEDRAEIEAGLDKLMSRESREKLGSQFGEVGSQLEEGAKKVMTPENQAAAQQAVSQLNDVVGKLSGAVNQVVNKVTPKDA